jgi:hypothetical protein
LVRYTTANRRAFDKSLQMLRQLPANEKASPESVDGDSDSPETNASAAQDGGGTPSAPAGNSSQKPEEASDLEEGA